VLCQWEAEIFAEGCHPRKFFCVNSLGIEMRLLTDSFQAGRALGDATFSMVLSSYFMNS